LKRIEIQSYGDPESVADCVDRPDVGAPAAGEVVFDVLAFPINPADISFCRGRYRLKPALPATPGAECVGRVAAVGAAVKGVRPGDLVINLERENWAQRRRVAADRVIVLPAGIDVAQAAMIRINPPTAALLLCDIVELRSGDWIIQNVANSAVGKLVIAFAKARGLRTVNVVRREDVCEELLALGADVCVLDGPALDRRVREKTGEAPIRLAIDAVAGEATARLSSCVQDGGTVCTYGSMSGENVVVPTPDLVFRGINFTGFMLGRFLERRQPDRIAALYAELAAKVRSGILNVAVERIYAIEDIKEALAHAQRGARGGKILVAPNGFDLSREA
jgi:NADPH:quinone reductase-like Zn-dependent oxidoreductase